MSNMRRVSSSGCWLPWDNPSLEAFFNLGWTIEMALSVNGYLYGSDNLFCFCQKYTLSSVRLEIRLRAGSAALQFTKLVHSSTRGAQLKRIKNIPSCVVALTNAAKAKKFAHTLRFGHAGTLNTAKLNNVDLHARLYISLSIVDCRAAFQCLSLRVCGTVRMTHRLSPNACRQADGKGRAKARCRTCNGRATSRLCTGTQAVLSLNPTSLCQRKTCMAES